MIKKTIIRNLVGGTLIACILSSAVLAYLLSYNRSVSAEAAENLGTLYMSEMMYQMQEHFETIVDMKSKEIAHVADHTTGRRPQDYREVLIEAAEGMDFEYLSLYDDTGNYDSLMGEAVWYRDLNGFVEDIEAGKVMVTTGYQTKSGGKYVVFGVPAEYEMNNGKTSQVLLAGFSVEKLYDYINLEKLEQLGSNVSVFIISTNGSYVLKEKDTQEESFFERLDNIGGFATASQKDGLNYIEKAMASREEFTCMVELYGEQQHFYGAPAENPSDWYFVISMPQGVSDVALTTHNNLMAVAYGVAGLVVLALFITVFIINIRISINQLRETEAARAEAEKAKEEAEIANKSKSEFLSNMSHDIRTPMNAIVGFAAIVEDSILSKNYDRAMEALGKMKHSSNYLRSLISDVLDMSKIESGSLKLIPENMSVQDLAESVYHILIPQTSAKDQVLTIDVHDILHDRVWCDHTRLNQILINLLGNATKFTPEGGKIDFAIWQQESPKGEDYIRTSYIIKDNGIGMSQEFINNMYESFAREEHRVRKIEGTGLGLTIVKRLVDMMAGEIQVDSTVGEGTQFTIVLDMKKVELLENTDAPEAVPMSIQGMRILLAEDNDFNYDIAEALLEQQGLIIERAENGRVAVDKYCENPQGWDLILMDLRMPVLNGYEATDRIREFEAMLGDIYHVPIYALSADVFAEDIQKCKDIGMEGHISKPIEMNELLKILSMSRKIS